MATPDVAMIMARRAAMGAAATRRRRTEVPRSLRRKLPRAAELSYVAFLRRHVREVAALIRQFYGSELKELTEQQNIGKPDDATQQKLDSPADDIRELTDAILAAASQLPTTQEAAVFVQNQALAVNTVNSAVIAAGSEAVLGVSVIGAEPWLADTLASYATENARLITSLSAQQVSEAEGIILRGFQSGERASSMGAKLANNTKKSLNRAVLIARDQTTKLFGNLTQLRQTSAGVKSYIWRTSQDDLVRDEHIDRDGQTFLWSKPPDDGHPGQPIHCRCTAEPVLTDLLRGL